MDDEPLMRGIARSGGDGEGTRWLLLGCFVLLGLASWITIDGIFQVDVVLQATLRSRTSADHTRRLVCVSLQELNLLAQVVPESYDIFSYGGVMVAAANVFPVAYVAATSGLSKRQRQRADVWTIVLVVYVLGTAVCLLLGEKWSSYGSVGGDQHSTWLLGLMFVSGGIDCLTSVS